MGYQRTMRRFARWHVWLGWLVGLPVLMWTLTGLVMVIKPIEEVRGNHLRKELPAATLPPGNPRPIAYPVGHPARYTEMRVAMQGDRAVWLLTKQDGRVERHPADMRGEPLPEVDERFARALVAERIVGGDAVESVRPFDAGNAPVDLRQPIPSLQVALADGTHVYIDADTGEIAAVRTRWWRVFDFAWGLHIMDLRTREDTSHPVLILFAAMGVLGSLLGCILMFRRRRARKVS